MSKKEANHEKSKGKKKNTSLRLEGEMLKALKIIALEEETSIQKIVEQLITKYLTEKGIVINETPDTDTGKP